MIDPERIIRLANKVGYKQYPHFSHMDYAMTPDDLASLALQRIIDCLPKYKPQLGNFETWASRVANGAIIDYYRHHTKGRSKPSKRITILPLSAFSAEESDAINTTILINPNVNETPGEGVDVIEVNNLRTILAQLPERERLVFYYTIGLGYSVAEMAQMLGISLTLVKKIRAKTLAKIQTLMGREGH